jgi:hypothetical protein
MVLIGKAGNLIIGLGLKFGAGYAPVTPRLKHGETPTMQQVVNKSRNENSFAGTGKPGYAKSDGWFRQA